jgi:hypothetical protein
VGCPSGQREQTVNLPANAYEGSNPSPTMSVGGLDFFVSPVVRSPQFVSRSKGSAGVAQLVER